MFELGSLFDIIAFVLIDFLIQLLYKLIITLAVLAVGQ